MISKRLSVIFAMVDENSAVADIGTDHAYLPIELIKSKRAKSVIAADIADKPLKNAEKNIKESGESVILRKSDGLKNISSNEADTIIIAGMGGDVIASIMQNCDWVKDKNKTFIFQPMTSAEVLRCFLSENGFSLVEEIPVSENGKYYSVMKYVFSGEKQVLPMAYKYIGTLTANTHDGRKYIEKQYNRLCKTVSQLKLAPGVHKEITSFEKTIGEIKAVLDKYGT